MNNQPILEQKTETVDIKEYLAILLKRKWLILVCFLVSMAGTTAFLFTRQPVYRSNTTLLVTRAGNAVQPAEVRQEAETTFFGTQVNIILSQTTLRRVQQRMKKTTEEIEELLHDLKVSPVRGSDLIVITVDSTSRDFARDFGNTLADEYLRIREEQRAQGSETALLYLTREVNRLNQELKAAQERILAYIREHNITDIDNMNYHWLKRYAYNAGRIAGATAALTEAKARKEFLDSRPDTTAVLALMSREHDRQNLLPMDDEVGENEQIQPGWYVYAIVTEAPQLNRRMKVSEDGKINFPPLGEITVQGATAAEAAKLLKDELTKSGVVRPQSYADAWGKMDANQIETLGRFEPTVRVVLRKTDDGQSDEESTILSRASLGVLTREEGARIFEMERRRQALEAKLAEARNLYKPRHPTLVALERELEEVTRDVKAELDFIRKKADAELLMAQKRYDEMMVVSKQLDAAAIAENSRIFEIKAMREDADRIRLLYNTLLGQLLKIDASAGFNTRTVSILEPATLEEQPVYPKKAKGLMMAAAFGLGLGLALAFFIEYIDDSIKLAEEVERELQLPFLGMIPAAQWDPDDLSAHRLDKLKQQGGVSEAYRVVRSAILFSQPRDKLRSILITSAVPREGKTTTAVNIATGFSQVEDRVLLVDADLRRGEVNKYFGLERANGLADILLGEATPEEVVRHTEVPKLDVVTSGSYPSNPAELLLGWRLKEFLEWAYKHYSRVVFDGPPVMGIADSAILGSAVDGVMLVIWAGRTSRRYVRVAKMTAVSRGAKIFGFILNNLEPSRVGYYHYYPYYYSYYSRGYYYAPKEGDKEARKGGDIKGIEVPTSNDNEKNIDDVY